MFRAVNALISGDVLQAIRYNALSVVLAPMLIVLLIRDTARYIRGALPGPVGFMEMTVCVSISAISLIYAIARNLPFLAILQPTNL